MFVFALLYPIHEKRSIYGEFHHLFPDLLKDDSKFFQYFRMLIGKFNELLDILKPSIEKENTPFRRSVPPEERLAVCLRYLSTGDSFRTISFSYRIGASSVTEIIYEVCQAIWCIMQPQCMPKPDREMWKKIEEDFSSRWNFPNCIGAIDGKHVVIEKPPNSGALFYNYKKTCSIVLLALVDAHYKFVFVDVGAMGKSSDGGVFSNSSFGKRLQQNKLNIPPDKNIPGSNEILPHFILADEAFPLQTHIMRPYPGNEVKDDKEKRTFNYRLSRARNTIEDAFGILTKRFRIYQRKLQMLPVNVTTCVLATCVLHNYLRKDSIGLLSEIPDEPNLGMQGLRRVGGQFTGTAIEIRDKFKTYFNSAEGAVSWQEKAVEVGKK